MSKKKNFVIYTVKQDDVLSRIAKAHGMTTKELLETPGNEKYVKNPDLIHPNDKVVVKPTYTVGDKTAVTLPDIAARHDTTVEKLLQIPGNEGFSVNHDLHNGDIVQLIGD